MTRIMEPTECTTVETIHKGVPDDILVCSGSPEERCKGIVRKLSPNYKANRILLLRYGDHDSAKRELNIIEMKNRLSTVGDLEEVIIDEEKPIPILAEIAQEIEKSITKGNPSISIDFTTIIKWHLLLFLKALDVKGFTEGTRFLYTEPEDYITNLFQPLSFGISKIFPVPTYSGDFDFYKDLLLVLMLGYEGERALAIFEEMDPDECLLLIAKPTYHGKEWEGRTEFLNKEIINVVGQSKIKYVDARDPLKVHQQLFKLLSSRENRKYNQAIAPLGTKPQTLGLYTYLSTNPTNTIVVYGSPSRHNEFYSQGIGRSWILPFR